MATKREGPLAEAAMAFEAELSRYEELTTETARGPISSEKALLRAKKQLGESAECQLRLAESLKAVVIALDGARVKQEACMAQVLAAAQRVQTRSEEFLTLMQRFSALGNRAREVNEPVAEVVARKSQGAPATEVLAGLRDVLARTEGIVTEAEALARDAANADWSDVSRAAEALKQQVQSARNRVLLAERTVSEQAPS
jgi:GrpB-like predicted nucleotidyltransferase (UPF0157 family)